MTIPITLSNFLPPNKCTTGCDPGANTTGNFECLDQRLSSLPENCVTDFDNIVGWSNTEDQLLKIYYSNGLYVSYQPCMYVPIIPFLLYFMHVHIILYLLYHFYYTSCMHCHDDIRTQIQTQTDPTAFCSTQCAIDLRAAYTICGFTGLEANPVNAGKHINIILGLRLTRTCHSIAMHVHKLHEAINDRDNIRIQIGVREECCLY